MKFLKQVSDWFKKTVTTPVVPTVPVQLTKPITVAIVNRSTVLTDAQIQNIVPALQIQVSRDFAPVYGIDANIIFVGKTATPSPIVWQLVILDTSDTQGALGYHDLTSTGLPLGKVFAKTDLQYGANWTITTSHELLEMLADPYINLTIFNQSSNTAGKLYPFEACDATEGDQFGYQINGIWVSDFVYPAWFGVPGSTTKLDHMDHLKKPLTLLPGGYIGVFDVKKGGGWTQITAQEVTNSHRHLGVNNKGSRRERRNRGHLNWVKSTEK